MTLRVVAHFRLRPEVRDEAVPYLSSLVAPTRQEDGCLQYIPLVDSNDPTHIVFVEEWRDRASFDRHLLVPGLQQVLSTVEPMLSEPIAVYELGESLVPE